MKPTNQEIGYFEHNGIKIQIAINDGYLTKLVFVEKTEPISSRTPFMTDVIGQLSEYFAGKRMSFDLKVKFEGTEFQKAVWNALLTIPYGETRTYKDIAIQIGHINAYRAVGMANHNNPISIVVPCHRVIGSSGALTGYAGGLNVKQQLLELEKVNSR